MKKLIYLGMACFMLLAVQACSGNAQKSASDETSQETVAPSASDPVYDKIMKLIEEATAKIKKNPNPQEAMKIMADMKIMAETSKNIDKCCEENGITLSDWKKNLSDDLKKNYEEATARFMEACEKIK